jgi:hypothetical protein
VVLEQGGHRIQGIRLGACQTVVAVQCEDAPLSAPPIVPVTASTSASFRVVVSSEPRERVVEISSGPWDQRTVLARATDDHFELLANAAPYYIIVHVAGEGWSSTYGFGVRVIED